MTDGSMGARESDLCVEECPGRAKTKSAGAESETGNKAKHGTDPVSSVTNSMISMV